MEEWRQIPGYEGIYEVSNLGQVRTCEGKITSNARYGRRVWKQRILKQKYLVRPSGKKGDFRVALWKDGKEKTHLVARLVALAWCPGYAANMTVNHIDGDSRNNKAENLEWVSLKENIQKGFGTGLYAAAQRPVDIEIDGEIHHFNTMREASLALGKSNGYVSNMMSERKKKEQQQ